MKVYVVYFSDFDGEFIADKAFLDKDKALDYIDKKHNTESPFGWCYESVEVVE